ncbi:hypothetical protein HY947_02655 [Candidatus Gottesmanbacteria bacterium]|nr:hypothetical protein [Candidatus Gottesmanbacteria bacterium]
MRNTFAKVLLEEAKKNKKVIFLTGDLGFSVFEDFQKECPDQFINAGVAEQNMTGVAAGLAMEGMIPIIYSIIPFVTMRNFEQIRNDICYQNLNVKIVAVGAGFSYGPYGHTHHGLEDIGIMRTLPGLTILAPGDPTEARLATEAMFKYVGPTYLRLGKGGEPIVHEAEPLFTIGKAIELSKGRDITIVTTSNMLSRGNEVRLDLETKGYSVGLVSMHTIKPLDVSFILRLSNSCRAIFTIEEHSIIGGLGSSVAEVLAEQNNTVIFKRFGVSDRFTKVNGSRTYLQKANGLNTETLSESMIHIMKKKKI